MTGSPTSTIQLNPGQRELVRLFRGLADEQRLRILLLLSESGEQSVTAISQTLGQSQPAISHHLNQLKSCGFIEFRRDGKFNYYSLSPTGLLAAFTELAGERSPAQFSIGGLELSVQRKLD